MPFQKPLLEVCQAHWETGHYGFSVQCAAGRTVEELASQVPHLHVGVTTVGKIRRLGYEVVRTPGAGFHATIVVPEDWTDDAARELAGIFQGIQNPTPRRPR